MSKFDKMTKKQSYEYLASIHKDTEAEELFCVLLERNGIEYQQEVIYGKHRVDFVLDDYGYELLGGYHNISKQRKKDKARATYLLKHFGLELKEITNEEVFKCWKGEISLAELLQHDDRCIEDKILVKPVVRKNRNTRKVRTVSILEIVKPTKRKNRTVETEEQKLYKKSQKIATREWNRKQYLKNKEWLKSKKEGIE